MQALHQPADYLCVHFRKPVALYAHSCLTIPERRKQWQVIPASEHRCRPLRPSRRSHSGCRRVKVQAASGEPQSISPPYNVVITGSTKGVGKALATEFVKAGDNVIISSRSDDRVRSTVRELSQLPGSKGQVKGCACNMAKAGDVAALTNFASNELGSIDIWINNAGSNAYQHTSLLDSSEADLVSIVETNMLGVMLGCREAIQTMRAQKNGGIIFNMDGAGASGTATPLFAAYGATKRGLAQLGKSLRAELRMQGISNVNIFNLSPGMVTTELLMSGADTASGKFFINCLAERPETVADNLVPRIRKAPQEARSLAGKLGLGSYIRFLTLPRAYGQIIMRLLTKQRKNKFVQEETSF
ncbi:hypothetical protein WJX73_005574 [Symbiochloris irregularis]|uniref:Chlorophyll b reductase n=1 Tax=Symbiochloris irregularis TaxID=706552 RepID=A0AAW1NSN2_9CHLO